MFSLIIYSIRCDMFGMAHLGGAKFKDVILKSHRKDLALAVIHELDGFGKAMPLFEAVANAKLTTTIQDYGVWKDGHDFSEKDLPLLLARGKEFNTFASQRIGIHSIYAPMLEHDIKDLKLLEHILTECQKIAPKCQIINVPVRNGLTTKKFTNEIHGIAPRIPSGSYNISNDGASLVDSDAEKWKSDHSSAGIRWIWDPNDNGRLETNDTTNRKDRNAYTTLDCNYSLMALTSDRGDQWIHAEPHFLYKSHAECHYELDHSLDSRSNKPCIITPEKVDHLELKTAFGDVVGTLQRYKDPYVDGRWRYYSSDYGYKIADKAVKLTKGPHVPVFAGSKQLATINPIFRLGEYKGD